MRWPQVKPHEEALILDLGPTKPIQNTIAQFSKTTEHSKHLAFSTSADRGSGYEPDRLVER